MLLNFNTSLRQVAENVLHASTGVLEVQGGSFVQGQAGEGGFSAEKGTRLDGQNVWKMCFSPSPHSSFPLPHLDSRVIPSRSF